MRDLHNNVDIIATIEPVAVGATNATLSGNVIDVRGYDAVEISLSYGAITATNATITPVILHGDVTGTMTSCADADLLGTEAAAGIAEAATRVDGVSENVTKRIGYIGGKRYVQANIVNTVTAATPVAANVILHRAHNAPVAT